MTDELEPVDPIEDAIAAEMTPEPEPDAEPDAYDAPEPEPEPEPDTTPDTEAVLEERGKKFDLLTKHVAKRTGEILGDDATLVTECPFCSYYNMPGFVPMIDHPPDLQAHVLAAFGQHVATDYAKDSYARACDKCNGLGETLSGSRVVGLDKLPCYDCQGRGWVAVGDERKSLEDRLRNGSTPAPYVAVPGELPLLPPDEDEPDFVHQARAAGYVAFKPYVATG